MKFYVGLHQPADSAHFDRAFISVNRLVRRRSPVPCADWIMDSGAFSQISQHGCFTMTVDEHAEIIARLEPSMAVSQDWMCEDHIIEQTGFDVHEHQILTIQNYKALLAHNLATPIMPVLQGYLPSQYDFHLEMYGGMLTHGMHVGVGSVCKRNSSPSSVCAILKRIKERRPDLKLHGFGLKITALQLADVRDYLYSADSMAWSYAARVNGRDGNSWEEAKRFSDRIENQMVQESLCL